MKLTTKCDAELPWVTPHSSSWLRNLASLLVTTTSSWAALSTISFLFLVETLWAISAQYFLQNKKLQSGD